MKVIGCFTKRSQSAIVLVYEMSFHKDSNIFCERGCIVRRIELVHNKLEDITTSCWTKDVDNVNEFDATQSSLDLLSSLIGRVCCKGLINLSYLIVYIVLRSSLNERECSKKLSRLSYLIVYILFRSSLSE